MDAQSPDESGSYLHDTRSIAARQHRHQPVQVLLVGRLHDVRNGVCHFLALELLCPVHRAPRARRHDAYRQSEQRLDRMADHDLAGPRNFRKAALVGIVLAIRAMHYEFPLSVGAELERLEGIGKPGRPPPPGENLWLLERSKDGIGRGWNLAR